MKNKRIFNIVIVVGVFIFFAFAFRKFWGLGMLAYNDCLPFPEKAEDAINMFFSAWDSRSPGINLPLRHGIFYYIIEWMLIKLCFGNAFLAQKVFLFLPMPLTFLAMFFFLQRFTKLIFARFVAAFIYSVNPITIGEFQGGWVANIYVQALLPIILMFLYRIRKRYKIKDILMCSIFLSIAYLLAEHILIFLVPFFLLFLFSDFFELNGNKRLIVLVRRLFIIFSLGLICCLLTLPQTIFFLKSAIPFIKTGGSQLRLEVLQQLVSDVSYCYGQSNLVTILRIGAGVQYIQIICFLPSFLALLSLFSIRDEKRRRYVITYFIGSLAIIIFIWLTYKKLTLGLFKTFPFLFRFRNHSRPLLLLTFVYAPLIAIGVEWILGKVKALFHFKRKIAAVCIVILLGIILTYNRSFFWGDYGILKAHGQGIAIPKVFYEISGWLESKRHMEGDFRTIWLPWDFNEEEVRLAWLDKYTLSVPIGYGQYATTPLLDYISFIYRSICYDTTEHLGALLVPVNVKYIILYLGSGQKGDLKVSTAFLTPYIFGDPEAFKAFLNRQKDLELIVEQEGYLIYENNKPFPENNIMCYKNIVLVSNSLKSDPLCVFSQLINDSSIDPSRELLIFKEQLKGNIDFFKNKSITETIYLKPLLEENFNTDNLNEKNWMPVIEPTYTIKNGEIILPLQQGKTEFLLSKQEFICPMTFEMRLKICKKDLPADIRLERYNANGMNFLYNGQIRAETYNDWKTTTTNFGAYDPTDYHVYKIIWEKDKVQFFIDNELKVTHTTDVTNKWVRIRFGGTSGQIFVIDYVRVEKGTFKEPIEIYRFDNNDFVLYRAKKVDNAEYKLEILKDGTLFMLLSEAYDKDWIVHNNNHAFEHFPAFYCFNGFYAKSVNDTINVIFKTKILKQFAIGIFVIAWVIICCFIFIYRR